jgi:hypothetical protein
LIHNEKLRYHTIMNLRKTRRLKTLKGNKDVCN